MLGYWPSIVWHFPSRLATSETTMAKELEELRKKLSFIEEEDEDIELGSGSTKPAKERGKNCAVLKVLSHRSISLDSLRKNMRMMWKLNKGVQI